MMALMANNTGPFFQLSKVSLPGFTELPGFLDALVDAESVLHNSDSESEFMSGVGGGCGNYYETVDYSNITIPQGLQIQGFQANSFANYGHSFHNHNQGNGHSAIFMDETSNSSSNNEQTETEQSPSCFLLESSSPLLDNPDPGTPLPSFQETYSPRYRRDVFNFDEASVSPSFSSHGGSAVGPSSSAPATPLSSGHHQQHHARRFPLTHQHSLDSPSSSTTASPQTPISYHQMYYPSQSPSYEIMHSSPPPLIPIGGTASSGHSAPKQRKM